MHPSSVVSFIILYSAHGSRSKVRVRMQEPGLASAERQRLIRKLEKALAVVEVGRPQAAAQLALSAWAVDTLRTFCIRWAHRAPPLPCRHPVRQPHPPCRSGPPAAARQALQARSAYPALLGARNCITVVFDTAWPRVRQAKPQSALALRRSAPGAPSGRRASMRAPRQRPAGRARCGAAPVPARLHTASGVPGLPRTRLAAGMTRLTGGRVGGQAGRTLRDARADGRAEVFGSSTALEKEYLRLTALPTLGAVRPPAVLEQVGRALKLCCALYVCTPVSADAAWLTAAPRQRTRCGRAVGRLHTS